MNNATTLVQSIPTFLNLKKPRQAHMIGASLFTIAVVLLEFWLRVPIKPALDLYLHDVLACTSTISAFVCRALKNARFTQTDAHLVCAYRRTALADR